MTIYGDWHDTGTMYEMPTLPNDSPRNLPTRKAVIDHWKDHIYDAGCEWELNSHTCFACGQIVEGAVDRAHILGRTDGGSDDVNNIHLLCPKCHKFSEHLSGPVYLEWFFSMVTYSHMTRAMMDVLYLFPELHADVFMLLTKEIGGRQDYLSRLCAWLSQVSTIDKEHLDRMKDGAEECRA